MWECTVIPLLNRNSFDNGLSNRKVIYPYIFNSTILTITIDGFLHLVAFLLAQLVLAVGAHVELLCINLILLPGRPVG